MCAVTVESNIPKVGETVQIVKTLYGGNDPNDPYGITKIRIYAPALVRVEGKRTVSHRDPHTNGIIATQMVRLVDLKTGQEYPEVKMGSLLHAAGLVEEEDLEGRGLFFQDELQRKPEGFDEPILAADHSLAELKAQMEAEEDIRRLIPGMEVSRRLKKDFLVGGKVRVPAEAEVLVRNGPREGDYFVIHDGAKHLVGIDALERVL